MSLGWFVIILIVLLFLYIPVPWIIGRKLKTNQKRKAISRNQIFLTFDDGPGNRLTPQILQILGENNIKATFFLLGRNVAGKEKMVQSIVEQGHSVASHSFSHYHAWKVAPWRAVSDIKKGWTTINGSVYGQKGCVPYRPPCGKMNIITLLYLWLCKAPIIFWSVDCLDTWPKETRNANYAAQKVQNDGGGVVLFHDFDRTVDTTDAYVIKSLESLIATGKKMGLKFVTIESLLSKCVSVKSVGVK